MQSCRSAKQMCACCKQYERIFKFTENEMTRVKQEHYNMDFVHRKISQSRLLLKLYLYLIFFLLKFMIVALQLIRALKNTRACTYQQEKPLTYQLIAMTVRFASWRFHHATCLKVIKSKLVKINFKDLLNKLFVKHFLSTGLFITICLIIPRFWT